MYSQTPPHLPTKPALSPKEDNMPRKVHPAFNYLAMTIFVLLPFIGFYLGMKYQQLKEYNSKDYVGDKERCPIIDYQCPITHKPFSDSIGCGCEKIER